MNTAPQNGKADQQYKLVLRESIECTGSLVVRYLSVFGWIAVRS
jgi:hypothetical protein